MDVASLKKIAFEKLSANLDDMLKQYRVLLELVRKEKDFLILADVQKLNENNLQKEILISKIKSLDASRLNYAIELAHMIQADALQPRLLELAQKMGGVEAEKLRNMHTALEIVIRRVSEINKSNEHFAQSALKTVSTALDALKDQVTGQKTYQHKGKYKQPSDNAGYFVKKEA